MKCFIYFFCIIFFLESCKNNSNICINPDKTASFTTMFPTYILKVGIDTFEICDFNYELVIDKKGKVVEAKSYNKKCRTDSLMTDYLLKMPNWNPAIKGKKKVKSVYRLKFQVRPQ